MKPLLLAISIVSTAMPVAAEPPSRTDLAALESRLDHAVSLVSRPAGLLVLGLPGTRAYRIPGMGIVFVLPPRALDIGRREVRFVRRSREERAPALLPEDELRVLEQQVLVFASEAQSTRRVAEQHAEAVERQIRVHLSPGSEEPTSDADAPKAPRPPTPPGRPPAPAQLPPPWLLWLQATGAPDPSPPDELVAQVRAAVIDTLRSHGARLVGLTGDERIAVAVDFVASGEPFAPPERQKTLIVTVAMKTLLDRAKGRLDDETSQKAFEVAEY